MPKAPASRLQRSTLSAFFCRGVLMSSTIAWPWSTTVLPALNWSFVFWTLPMPIGRCPLPEQNCASSLSSLAAATTRFAVFLKDLVVAHWSGP
eukprot:261222-Amphidinium_carterae.1